MRIEELKKGFWGFQKDGVFRFIAQQEEAFAQKLAEKDAQMERRSQQDQERIQRLEEENRQLQAELERFQKQQDLIAQAILDARTCTPRSITTPRAAPTRGPSPIFSGPSPRSTATTCATSAPGRRTCGRSWRKTSRWT